MLVLYKIFLGPYVRMSSLTEQRKILIEQNYPCPEGATRDMSTLVQGKRYMITDPMNGTNEPFIGILARIVPDHKVDRFYSSKTETGYYFEGNSGGRWFYPNDFKCYGWEDVTRKNITEIYEQKTNQSGEPGHGPANIIAAMVGTKKSHYEEEKELEKLDDLRKKLAFKLENLEKEHDVAKLKFETARNARRFNILNKLRNDLYSVLPAKREKAADEYRSILAKLNLQAAKVKKMMTAAAAASNEESKTSNNENFPGNNDLLEFMRGGKLRKTRKNKKTKKSRKHRK